MKHIAHSQKTRVGIVFGGKSAEHNISVRSARSLVEAIDTELFEPILIGIDKSGVWHLCDASRFVKDAEIDFDAATEITFRLGSKDAFLSVAGSPLEVDIVFPILHGPMGEDGTVQGLLELMDIPYVGSPVLGSAINMDKDVMKRLLQEAGIPITDHVVLRSAKDISVNAITTTLGLPLFVKPANMGSSVGVTKVETADELVGAITEAFSYDQKVLIEAAVEGDEIECSILGNDHPEASLPGRVILGKEFYDYEAKYTTESGTGFEIPAALSAELTQQIQEIALNAYRVLECKGFARVDMFLTRDKKVLLNEINTIPGFTNMSVYPMLWQASDVSYADLISQLIQLGLDRYTARKQHFRL